MSLSSDGEILFDINLRSDDEVGMLLDMIIGLASGNMGIQLMELLMQHALLGDLLEKKIKEQQIKINTSDSSKPVVSPFQASL